MQDKPKIILTGAVIIAILISGYFYYQSRKQGAPGEEARQVSQENATTTREAEQKTSEIKTTAATTKIPNWKTYRSAKYGVEVQFPLSWTIKEGYISGVLSGDLVITAIKGWTIDAQGKFKIYTIDEIASTEIIARNFGSFGKSPAITKTTVAGQPARLITSSKEGLVRGGLLVGYPKPVSFDNEIHYYFMIYFFHSDYINTIKNTVKFYGM